MKNRMKFIGMLIVSSLAFACESEAPKSGDKSADPEKTPTTAAPEVPAKPEVKEPATEEPAAAGTVNCDTYFQEVADLCRASLNDGVEVSCFQLFMFSRMAKIQSRGVVVKGPDGRILKPKESNTTCQAPLMALRKQKKEAKTGEKPAWGPQCTQLILEVDSTCLSPLAKGEFVKNCDKRLQVLADLKPGEAAEVQCETTLSPPKTPDAK